MFLATNIFLCCLLTLSGATKLARSKDTHALLLNMDQTVDQTVDQKVLNRGKYSIVTTPDSPTTSSVVSYGDSTTYGPSNALLGPSDDEIARQCMFHDVTSKQVALGGVEHQFWQVDLGKPTTIATVAIRTISNMHGAKNTSVSVCDNENGEDCTICGGIEYVGNPALNSWAETSCGDIEGRYVRLTVNSTIRGTWNFCRIKIMGFAGYPILTAADSPTTSSVVSFGDPDTYGPSNALLGPSDGEIANQCKFHDATSTQVALGAVTPQFWQVDLGQTSTVATVAIRTISNVNGAKNASVSVCDSENGEDCTICGAIEYDGTPALNSWANTSCDMAGRYVRMTVTQSPVSGIWHFCRVRVMGNVYVAPVVDSVVDSVTSKKKKIPDPVPCGENERAKNKECVACQSGWTNPAGDNKFGRNTFCQGREVAREGKKVKVRMDGDLNALSAEASQSLKETVAAKLGVAVDQITLVSGSIIVEVTYGSDEEAIAAEANTAALDEIESAVTETIVTSATTAEEEYQAQVKGDPHFLGFDGSRFDFQGSPGSVFNLITDEEFQLNARFMESPTDGKTYLGVIGLKSGSDQILITPDVVILNNEKVQEGAHASLHGKDREEGLLIIAAGRVRIKTGSFQVNIQMAQADGFAYLDIESASAVSDNLVHPHGILGQTAQYMVEGTEPQPVHLSHKNLDARGFLDGVASDYVVTDGLMGDGFTFNRFGVKKQQISPAVRRRFSFARASYEEKGRN